MDVVKERKKINESRIQTKLHKSVKSCHLSINRTLVIILNSDKTKYITIDDIII